MIDLEASILTAIMADNSAYWRCCDLIDATDFAEGANRRLWTVIAELVRAESAADAVTICELHPNMTRHVMALTEAPGSVRNVRTYAELIAAKAIERRVRAAGGRIATLLGADAYAEAQRVLAACAPRSMGRVKLLKAHMREWFAATADKAARGQVMVGVSTGLPKLDEMLGGWQRGDLIVLAARPSVGKTALMLQFALTAAGAGCPAFIASAEMSGAQLADRAVANLGGVPSHVLRRPASMQDEDWAAVSVAAERGHGLPVWIDDSPGLTTDAIAGRARQLDAENRIGLVAIDYLQHLTLPKAENVAESIQVATRQLKSLAKELSVPVLLLSQLNREGTGRPTLAHLRGSGAIEQDADIVMLLSRPDEENRNTLLLDVAKNRNGECGEIYLEADLARMRFAETSGYQAPRTQKKRGTFADNMSGKDAAAGKR